MDLDLGFAVPWGQFRDSPTLRPKSCLRCERESGELGLNPLLVCPFG